LFFVTRHRGERLSDPLSDPEIRCDRAPAGRSVRSEPGKSERERRVVEGLKGGVSMVEIARREGITQQGFRKYVLNLYANHAPEANREFIATQMIRLNAALNVSFGAKSAENLPAVDRVVKIVRELDRCHGVAGGARGTEARRKLLENLVSGAETDPCPTGAALCLARAEALAEDVPAEDDLHDPLADVIPDPAALADRLSQGAQGTGMRRNLLESLDSGAGTAPAPSRLVREDMMAADARPALNPNLFPQAVASGEKGPRLY
jgi:DNA-binding CsgD family transcriptional regulator